MRKKRSNGGFTLAELLIVVAIIGVLSGVAFIAVQNHEKSLTQLERDTIAKEIFIAAQNHLTMAKSQNYNGCTNYGKEGDVTGDYKGEGETKEQIAYYFSNNGFDTNGDSILDQMLPFGSIDETIRSGGDYIIRYQPSAGLVLDVFYWDASDKKYGGTIAEDSAYATLMGMRGEEQQQKRARLNNKPMVGWFGGEETVETGAFLETPSIEVINAEKLIVKVTDKNVASSNSTIKDLMKPMLKLILSGNSSGAKIAFTLNNIDASGGEEGYRGKLVLPQGGQKSRLSAVDDTSKANEVTYTIVLDDITADGMRFAQLGDEGYLTKSWEDTTKSFIPGEDITVQAVAYSNTYLSSVAYSGEWTVNSLFGGLREETAGNVALISNIRHLENLDKRVSSVNETLFAGAEQTVNLDWNDFIEDASIYSYGKDEDDNDVVWATKPGCYLPVSPSYALVYNGRSEVKDASGAVVSAANHSIANIVVNDTEETTDPEGTNTAVIDAGGVFGTLAVAGSRVSNLAIKDISVTLTASGNAGALAGTIANTNISNVVAYNTDARTTASISAPGSVGGLIGSVTASAATYKVEKSAAALIVSSTGGNAGGLIGTTSGGTVTACYSGGHTIDMKDSNNNIIGILYDNDNYNVTAAGYAGGLIGDAGDTEVQYCYSTCSVESTTTAGGLLGKSTAEKDKIDTCYATGLVSASTSEGALVGELSTDSALKACKYFEIINERIDETNGGYTYLGPVGNKTDYTISEETVIAIDASASAYNTFVGEPSSWTPTVTYDGKATETTDDDWLDIYYGGKYNLQNIKRLGGDIMDAPKEETNDNGSIKTTPADYVATHYGDWPAPEIFVLNEAG